MHHHGFRKGTVFIGFNNKLIFCILPIITLTNIDCNIECIWCLEGYIL